MATDHPRPHDQPRETPPRSIPLGRAAFLGTVAAGIGGIALAPRISNALSGAADLLPNAVRQLAPTQGWRIYSVASPMPTFDSTAYRLRIDGLVQRPQDLSWGEVAALPGATQISDFHCVTGWTVQNVHWEGVRPRTLLELVRPHPEARYVTLSSLEGPYEDQLSLAQFRLADVLLARHMDGRPLSRVHGAPLRLVIPRMYGYKNVKWVKALRFDAAPRPGYWEQRGYDVDAWVGHSNGSGGR